jgi:hypothetical protein
MRENDVAVRRFGSANGPTRDAEHVALGKLFRRYVARSRRPENPQKKPECAGTPVFGSRMACSAYFKVV